jgi:hypothetical protein
MSSTAAAAILPLTPMLPDTRQSLAGSHQATLAISVTAPLLPLHPPRLHLNGTMRGHRSQQCSPPVVLFLQAVKQNGACQHGYYFSGHAGRHNQR